MICGELTKVLAEHGYRVGDLCYRLWNTKGTCASYNTIAAYCRASDLRYGKPEVWRDIRDCLKEMNVEYEFQE